LLDSATGDVILLVGSTNPNDDSQIQKRLYAYKSILIRNSEYFASSISSSRLYLHVRFETRVDWETGEQENGNFGIYGRWVVQLDTLLTELLDIPRTSSSLDTSDSRQIIYFTEQEDDIDFVTLHNILYFIYIGCVNLPFPDEEADSRHLPDGYPKEAEPFRLFRAADRFLLPTLKERCFSHLSHGVTTENVVERLFHPGCEHHDELRQHYLNYLIANFDVVKQSEQWDSVICPSEEVSSSVSRYRDRLLLEITKRLTQ